MMRLIPLVLLALVVSHLVADEPKPTPTRLTKEQLSLGWIDLFDGESLFGWQPVGDSKWNVAKGFLVSEGDRSATLMTSTAFDNYDLFVEYQTRNEGAEILVRADKFGKAPEVKGGDVEVPRPVKLETTGLGKGTVTVEVRNGKVAGGRSTMTSDPIGLVGTTMAYKVGLVVPAVKPIPTPGQIGLRGTGLIVRAVRLRPVDAKPLFNGKNLDGWKVFEGKKGKFAVDEAGCLSVKDGPGDIATLGEYRDFVLQLECKTNGKHLNSGIFFRAIPGLYQQGYEAQIHNGFLEKPKMVDVEYYDPKTNKLLEKKKVETLASDFGSGAIYRRIPSRKQAAQDNEWFSMTVVANGRNISTWVNGVQVVDWTDNRPLKENARLGCYLDKGVISIQAHDPTTDLLFRNLRIVELGK